MADQRFKPIGGMFQGVTGSTKEGGTASDAGKLVILGENGKISADMLPEGVADAASLAEDLAREVRAREDGDSNLLSMFNSLDMQMSNLGSTLHHEIDQNKADLEAADAEIRSEVSSLAGDMAEFSGKLDEKASSAELESAKADISTVSSVVTANKQSADNSIGNLTSAVNTANATANEAKNESSAAYASMTGIQSSITAIQANLNGQQAEIGAARLSAQEAAAAAALAQQKADGYENGFNRLVEFQADAAPKIASLNTEVFGNGDSQGLSRRVSALETTSGETALSLASLNSDVENLKTGQDSLYTEVIPALSNRVSAIEAIGGSLSDINSRISAVDSAASRLSDVIFGVSGTSDGLVERTDQAESSIMELQAAVASLLGDTSLIKGDIQLLKESVDELYRIMHGDSSL